MHMQQVIDLTQLPSHIARQLLEQMRWSYESLAELYFEVTLYIYMYMHGFMYVCIYAIAHRLLEKMRWSYALAELYFEVTYIYTYMYIYFYMHQFMCVCMYVCMYAYRSSASGANEMNRTCTDVRIYIHTHTHTWSRQVAVKGCWNCTYVHTYTNPTRCC